MKPLINFDGVLREMTDEELAAHEAYQAETAAQINNSKNTPPTTAAEK